MEKYNLFNNDFYFLVSDILYMKSVDLYNINGKYLGYVSFHIDGNNLHIDNIVSYFPNDLQYHYGTMMMVNLLHFLSNKYYISSITGNLSYVDNVEKGWKQSIPFYYHLPQYLYEYLGISFSFHIYDSKYSTDMDLKIDNNIYEFTDSYMKRHKKEESDGWFLYIRL